MSQSSSSSEQDQTNNNRNDSKSDSKLNFNGSHSKSKAKNNNLNSSSSEDVFEDCPGFTLISPKSGNKYIFESELGEGSFGEVWKATSSSGDSVAVKIIDKARLSRSTQGPAKAKQIVQREIDILKQIDHKNVIKLYDVIEIPNRERMSVYSVPVFPVAVSFSPSFRVFCVCGCMCPIGIL
jgi:hypothetical protein